MIKIILLIVVVLLMVVITAMYLVFSKQRDALAQELSTVAKQLKEVNTQFLNAKMQNDILNKRVDDLKNQFENQVAEILTVPSKSQNTRQERAPIQQPLQVQKAEMPVKRYAAFAQVESTGRIYVERRDLTEDASGKWFVVNINPSGNTATYTVNEDLKHEMLAELGQMEMFANIQSRVNNPTDIQVVSPGKLKLEDKMWIDTAKLIINLI